MEFSTLFNMSEFEKRKTASQEEFEKQHIDLLMSFPEMVERSFKRLNKHILSNIELKSRDRNLAATTISGFLRGELIQAFPHYCNHATKGRFRLKSDSNEWIYIKKLDHKKRPSNVTTVNSAKIYNQLSDSKKDISSNVFLGYTSKDMTQATGTYAVCIDGDECLWITDLNTLSERMSKTIKLDIVPIEEIKIKEGIVKLKKDRQAG